MTGELLSSTSYLDSDQLLPALGYPISQNNGEDANMNVYWTVSDIGSIRIGSTYEVV